MPHFAALFRAVNLPSHGKLSMAELRAMLAQIGLRDAKTVLQSGNAVFSSSRSAGTLEKLIERELLARLAVQTDVIVRSGPELGEVIATNPFRREAASDPGHLLVVFLKSVPVAGAIEALRAAIAGPERVHGSGRELYASYPDGVGRSKLTAALIERKLGARGTARNWNTLCKLRDLVAGEGAV